MLRLAAVPLNAVRQHRVAVDLSEAVVLHEPQLALLQALAVVHLNQPVLLLLPLLVLLAVPLLLQLVLLLLLVVIQAVVVVLKDLTALRCEMH
jgi:hypothetical protein